MARARSTATRSLDRCKPRKQVLRRLGPSGLVKVRRVTVSGNKLAGWSLSMPCGVGEEPRLTHTFLRITMEEHSRFEMEIAQLRRESDATSASISRASSDARVEGVG